MMSGRDPLPLHGVRVLDLTIGALGVVGRTLRELGADVVRIEPRRGGADRNQGPSVAGIALDFAAANLGKCGVALDLNIAADRQAFETLISGADILIENTRPGSPEAKILDVAALHARHPSLVVLSVSDFGATGAYAQWQATDPVLHALSGGLSRSGIPGRAPLLPPGELAIQCAASQGVFVVLCAYLNRLQTGRGDLLDLSLLDASYHALDPGYGMSGSATGGAPANKLPRGRAERRFLYPIFRCADGFVRLCILAPRQWRGMFEWLGRPDQFADPSFNNMLVRYKSPDLIPHIARFFAGQTQAELEAAGRKYGVPTAAVLSLETALETDHMVARKAILRLALAPGVSPLMPNGMMEIDGERAGLKGPPPAIGQDQDAVLGAYAGPRPMHAVAAPSGARILPFKGLKVLDLGVIVVGAEQSRLLADLGADVIKVENAAFPDGNRQTRGEKISITFAAGHRNKRSLGLNLRDPEGKALFLQLAADADVIFSNFKPGTLQSLGLAPETLMQLNPRLIMADSSAFGPTGPWSGRMGYGPLVRAAAGLTLQWHYDGEPDSFSDFMTIYPDHACGRVGAAGVVALLIRRLRTGRGGVVSVAQAEVMLSHMSAQVAAVTAAAKGYTLQGCPGRDAPWGAFPCAGDDEWCVVSVRGDADWQALCGVIGRADLGSDPSLATAQGRAGQRARVDDALATWLIERSPHDAMNALQSAGVPAGAMLRVVELPATAYYVDRGLFRLFDHPFLPEPVYMETAPVRSEHLADPPDLPAPLQGQQTIEIARERLGLSEADIGRLLEAKVLEAPPHEDVDPIRKLISSIN